EGEEGEHGMAAVINEKAAPYELFNGLQKWNAYDIQFRGARFDSDGNRTERAMVTMYFNGEKVHQNVPINFVSGGACSGLDGANDGGNRITPGPGGVKLQAEGHDVRYRNIWMQPMHFEEANTNF
ncbi:MAG: family 16 glycoside hydrolase, partial [Rhodothermales bacterium]